MEFNLIENISLSDWNEWRSLQSTKFLVAGLLDTREELKEGIVEGRVLDRELWIAIGRCQALKDVVEFIIEKRSSQPNVESDSLSSDNQT